MKIGKVENIKNSNAYSSYDNNTYTIMLPKSICDDSQLKLFSYIAKGCIKKCLTGTQSCIEKWRPCFEWVHVCQYTGWVCYLIIGRKDPCRHLASFCCPSPDRCTTRPLDHRSSSDQAVQWLVPSGYQYTHQKIITTTTQICNSDYSIYYIDVHMNHESSWMTNRS